MYADVGIQVPWLTGLEKGLISTSPMWVYILQSRSLWTEARENDFLFF